MKGYINPSLIFPIIIKTPDNVSTIYTSEKPLIKIRKKTLERRLLEGVVIIDSSGMKYRVAEVKNLGYSNLFFGINVFLESMVDVAISLKEIEKLDIEQFRIVARDMVRQNSDYYISSGRKTKDVISQINSGETYEDITNGLM